MKIQGADLLEYEELRRLLQRYVASSWGARKLEEMAPSTAKGLLEQEFEVTGEAIEYLKACSRPQPAMRGSVIRLRFDGLPDCRAALAKLKIEGSCLEPKEVLDLLELADRATEIRRLILSVEERFPKLAGLARRIADFRGLTSELSRWFLPDGTVADDASPELARVRREMDRQRRLIQESLERFLRQHKEEDLLQEEFITIRNDRFVIPVVAGRHRRIQGVVHASSGSGHTLFVEPLETIELNNELVRLVHEELREVHRVLMEATTRFRQRRESLEAAAEALAELEWLFARAAFARDFDCCLPRFSKESERKLSLRRARHPLLEDVLSRQGKRVVPLSLELDEGCRTLLVSGPNTGGKTVVLKTVGLLALMAQSGLPVPAEEAELPLFEEILADIGDNQSIEASLSTFSAHIERLREMLEAVGPRSLVLLDELGRATDPEEGGALGAAVLERFRAAGAFTLASTHLLALKAYGASTPGVVNGSMGFNETTLEPTYELKLGAPGKSAGLEIAQRLGLPEELIEEARIRLGHRELEVSRFLGELHRRLEEVTQLAEQLRREREALAAREKALAAQWAAREEAKLREIERRCAAALVKFEAQARETIEKIAAQAEGRRAAAQAMRQVARVKRELAEEIERTALSVQDEARRGDLAVPRVVEGARVRLKGVSEPARVRKILPDERLEVEAGFMRLQVGMEDVVEVLPAAEGKGTGRIRVEAAPMRVEELREVNVIGKRAEEAREEVERALDRAVLAGVTRLRVVHGHGMGVLKRTVAELLAGHPLVEKFYEAEQREGGAGATIVELKS